MNTSESNRLLDECRALMTNRMRSSMSRMMGHVEEVLFEMATVDSKTADTSHYIEAIREIRMKKKGNTDQVRKTFHEPVRRQGQKDEGAFKSSANTG